MTLRDLILKYTFNDVYAQLELMLEDAPGCKESLKHAYQIMQEIETIPSKKTIHYQLIDDPENDECYSGAPDTCFSTTWEVILAKEVTVDEECELSDIELLANAFICTIILGRCPRAFLPEKRKLLGEA